MTAKHGMWTRFIDNTEHALGSALTVCLSNFWDRCSFLSVPLRWRTWWQTASLADMSCSGSARAVSIMSGPTVCPRWGHVTGGICFCCMCTAHMKQPLLEATLQLKTTGDIQAARMTDLTVSWLTWFVWSVPEKLTYSPKKKVFCFGDALKAEIENYEFWSCHYHVYRMVSLLHKFCATIVEQKSPLRWWICVSKSVSSSFIYFDLFSLLLLIEATLKSFFPQHCSVNAPKLNLLFWQNKITSVISQHGNKQCQRVKDLLPWPLWLLWHLINIKLTDQIRGCFCPSGRNNRK